VEADPAIITERIKGLAKFYNAKLVGVTEMPMLLDTPEDFGVIEFCLDCGLCIANCPFTYGISEDLISNIKSSSETRGNILKDFEERYGIRPIIREEPEWLK
jgi:ferredoxin